MKGSNTDTLWTFSTGGLLSMIAYLVGGIDKLVIALSIFMICDYVTGVLAGSVEGKISSKRAFRGLFKKVVMIVFVIIANQFDIISGNIGGFLRNSMVMFLIGTEGISILENSSKLGLRVPRFISDTFEHLGGTKEKKEKKDEKIQ